MNVNGKLHLAAAERGHMDGESYQKKVLHQYRLQETLLSRLYSVFARLFPEHKAFWEKLSLEEDKHARLIEKLSQATQKGLVLFDEGKIKTFALETFLKRLEMLIAKAEKKEINALQAFTLAADFETSLIEKNVFTRFEALTEKGKNVLWSLNSETLDHIERVKKMQKQAGRPLLKGYLNK